MPAHHIAAQHFRQFTPTAPERVARLRAGRKLYIPMRDLLVQGARPTRQDVLLDDGAQFGYRCTLEIITQPGIGRVEIAEDQIGFNYYPLSSVWIGHDSFSYALKTFMGQKSDAECLHIFVGM